MDQMNEINNYMDKLNINGQVVNEKENNEIKRRKVLDIGCKKLIIELSKQGLSHQAIANRLKVGRSTVTKILLNKKLMSEGALDFYDDSRKRLRKGEFDDLEIELFKWCTLGLNIDNKPKIYKGNEAKDNNNVNNNNENIELINIRREITKQDLINYAYNLAAKMNLINFAPTASWLLKFQRKFQLDLTNILSNNPLDNTMFTKPNPFIYNNSNSFIVKSNIEYNNNNNINRYPIIVPDIQIDNVCTPIQSQSYNSFYSNNHINNNNNNNNNENTSPLLLSNDQFQQSHIFHSANVSPNLSATPQFESILGYSDPLENHFLVETHSNDNYNYSYNQHYNNNNMANQQQPYILNNSITNLNNNLVINDNTNNNDPNSLLINNMNGNNFPSATYDSLHQNQLGFY